MKETMTELFISYEKLSLLWNKCLHVLSAALREARSREFLKTGEISTN